LKFELVTKFIPGEIKKSIFSLNGFILSAKTKNSGLKQKMDELFSISKLGLFSFLL